MRALRVPPVDSSWPAGLAAKVSLFAASWSASTEDHALGGLAMQHLNEVITALESFVASATAKYWRSWVQSAVGGAASKAHAFIRKWSAEVPALPTLDTLASVAAAEQQRWKDIWQRAPSAEPAEYETFITEGVTPEEIEIPLRALQKRAASGADRLEVSLLRGLSLAGRVGLSNVLTAAGRRGSMPCQAVGSNVAMLPKPIGGHRPVSLLSVTYRLWCKIKFPVIRAFENGFLAAHDMAAPGGAHTTRHTTVLWKMS